MTSVITAIHRLRQGPASPYGEPLSSRQQAGGYSAVFLYKGQSGVASQILSPSQPVKQAADEYDCIPVVAPNTEPRLHEGAIPPVIIKCLRRKLRSKEPWHFPSTDKILYRSFLNIIELLCYNDLSAVVLSR
jgi:hypothetical protein